VIEDFDHGCAEFLVLFDGIAARVGEWAELEVIGR
jgi:hypothetical protein